MGFVFNAKDQDEYNFIQITYSTTKVAPYNMKLTDGQKWVDAGGWRADANAANVASLGNDLWIRVTCNGGYWEVREATTKAGLDSVGPCCAADSRYMPTDGGFFGFLNLGSNTTVIDDLTIKRKTGASYTTEMVDQFTAASGTAKEQPVHDAAGNLTYDGRYGYT